MTLLVLIALLVVPFLTTKFALRDQKGPFDSKTAFRAGLSVFFVFTSAGHFLKTEEMSLMIGDAIPNPLFAVQVTGVLEFLAVLGIWAPQWRQVAGYCLIAMMIAFLPFNICAAIDHVPFGGHELGPVYLLVRVPFQFFVIWWVAKATAIEPGQWLCGSQKTTDPKPV